MNANLFTKAHLNKAITMFLWNIQPAALPSAPSTKRRRQRNIISFNPLFTLVPEALCEAKETRTESLCSHRLQIQLSHVSNFSGDKHININQFDTFFTGVLTFMLG
jgi:hypothetical protein